MSGIKSLWASVQGDPVFMRRVNGWLTVFWIVMIPVSIFTGWINSVAYISALSLLSTRFISRSSGTTSGRWVSVCGQMGASTTAFIVG